MATNEQWSRGYARQSDADFEMFQRLSKMLSVNPCHSLLFLQMACEKLVKAYLCGEGADPTTLQTSHAFTAAILPRVLKGVAAGLTMKPARRREVNRAAKLLAQEVEALAPAVKRQGQRPDNCEYPWADGNGELHVPLDWSFSTSELLHGPAAPTLLKLIRVAIDRRLAETEAGA